MYMYMYYGLSFYLISFIGPLFLLMFISLSFTLFLLTNYSAYGSMASVLSLSEGSTDSWGSTLASMTWLLAFGCALVLMNGSGEDYFLYFLLTFMTYCSLMTFMSQNIIEFYVNFEMTLFPILGMILGWGYQPERLSATLALVMYTIGGSLPLLVIVVILSNNSISDFFQVWSLGNDLGEGWVSAFASVAFLVKLPMFLMHMWLPKAHVEAPVFGSMFLAGTLLKLGAIGLIRMSVLSSMADSDDAAMISLLGLVLVGGMAVFNLDMKVIIAYSSVAHMGLALLAMNTGLDSGLKAALVIFLAHGFSSSMMFFMANLAYSSSFSRNILMNYNMISASSLFSFFWFLSCLGLMGGPPASTLVGEVLAISLASINWPIMIPMMVMGALLGGVYSFNLFSQTFHNYSNNCLKSLSSFSYLEILVSTFHAFWLLAYCWVFSWMMLTL